MKPLFKAFMVAVLLLIYIGSTMAQDPPPPPQGGGQGGNNNVPGGGAPLTGGLGILLLLGAAYGINKVHQFNINEQE